MLSVIVRIKFDRLVQKFPNGSRKFTPELEPGNFEHLHIYPSKLHRIIICAMQVWLNISYLQKSFKKLIRLESNNTISFRVLSSVSKEL